MYQRPYTPPDLEKVVDLLMAYRGAGYVNRYPTVWRIRLLLSSRLWDVERDAQIWEDDEGNTIGFAMLSKRRLDNTACSLERVVVPYEAESMIPQILEWGMQRAHKIALEKQVALSIGIVPLEKNAAQDIALLVEHGFGLVEDAYNVYMGCHLKNVISEGGMPAGFQISPLEEYELEEYQALYGFAAVLLEHQRELIHHPEYQHFVAKTANGKMVAYLECSFSRAEWARSRQHIGWIDYVETHLDYQGYGLGRALMQQAFQYLKSQGATNVSLVTTSNNQSAQAMYGKVGMEIVGEEHAYTKIVTPE